MRKQLYLQGISEEVKSLSQILEQLSDLRARVAKLEMKVFTVNSDNIASQPRKPNKGRKPRLPKVTLLNRRDNLTAWLEKNWPRLSVAMRRAEKSGKTPEAIAALVAIEKNTSYSPYQTKFYESPTEFEMALASFLKSGRFHGNPKNLAAAMAGLPELSWKRSFDICIAHTSNTGVALPAYRDYVRRKFPDRFRELEKAKTESDVRIALARSRSSDPVFQRLKANPDKVKEWLEAGRPKPAGR
jgi:hypothetical protein